MEEIILQRCVKQIIKKVESDEKNQEFDSESNMDNMDKITFSVGCGS